MRVHGMRQTVGGWTGLSGISVIWLVCAASWLAAQFPRRTAISADPPGRSADILASGMGAAPGITAAIAPPGREVGKRANTVPVRLAAFPVSSPHAYLNESFATPRLVAWLTEMVRDNMPPSYVDDRKWGMQKEVWDGVKLWREHGRLETKRKTKTVNHGTWTRYAIEVVEPDRNLQVEFHRLELLPDSRIAFAVTVECPLDVFGRLSHWARDVQLISISANADAAVRLAIDGSVQCQLNMLTFPPDIIIKPHVDHAHVTLTHYRVRRISQVGGDFARLLGNSLRSVVDERLEIMNLKLVDKINLQLEKHSQRFQFSTHDWLQSKLPMPPHAAPPES